MKPRKLMAYAITAFLLYFAVTNPTEAAGFVRSFATGAGQFAAVLAGGGQ